MARISILNWDGGVGLHDAVKEQEFVVKGAMGSAEDFLFAGTCQGTVVWGIILVDDNERAATNCFG